MKGFPARIFAAHSALLAIPRRYALAGALLIALVPFSVAPASATLFTSVSAEINSGSVIPGVEADNAANQNPPEKAVHGVAEAAKSGSNAFVIPGSAGPCDFSILAGCAIQLPTGRAAGEARGDLGRLRAQALATTDLSAEVGAAFSEVTVRLGDVLRTASAGDVTVHLHLSVDVVETGLSDNVLADLFQLRFNSAALGILTLPEFLLTTPDHEDSHIVIDRDFVLPGLPADALITLSLEMLASAECSANEFVPGGGTCSVFIDAGNTAYIGVAGDVVSLSGYSYPGFTPPVGVPAPATFALFAFGLIGLGAMRRRR